MNPIVLKWTKVGSSYRSGEFMLSTGHRTVWKSGANEFGRNAGLWKLSVGYREVRVGKFAAMKARANALANDPDALAALKTTLDSKIGQ